MTSEPWRRLGTFARVTRQRLHQPVANRLSVRLLRQVVHILHSLGQTEHDAVPHGFPPPGEGTQNRANVTTHYTWYGAYHASAASPPPTINDRSRCSGGTCNKGRERW